MKARRPVAVYTTAGAYARTYWKTDAKGRYLFDEKGRPVHGVVVDEPAYRIDNETRDMLWRTYTKWDRKLFDRSERLWTRLCENCATHPEAVAKYTKWAERAAGRVKATRK